MTQLPYPLSESDAKSILHVDVCQIEYEILTGKKHMAVAVHEDTDYSFVATLATKDEAGRFTREIITFIEKQTGYKIKTLRSDNGGEFVNNTLGQWLKDEGIHHQYTISYSPQQNGKAERINRTLQEMARCMLADAQLPNMLWAEAINTANFIRNITLRPSKDIVPYKEFWGVDPTYANLRVFGSKAYALIPKQKRTSKMDPVCEMGMMVGYCTNAKGYRILVKNDDGAFVVIEKRDVVFDETQVGMDACFPSNKRARSPSPVRVELHDAPSTSNGAAGASAPLGGRDGGRIRKPPAKLDDYFTYFDMTGEEILCLYVTEDADGNEIVEPLTLEQALASPQREEWIKALNKELASLLGNKTWDLVKCPKGITPLPCKWVFKIKRNAAGEIERYKCRLVAKGFKQKFGVDYVEVSAPVARLPTVRTIFALAAAHGWELQHLDTDTAFLHGVLEEKIYMMQPPGFEQGGADTVCLLNKCIYGLKQAPLVWHETLKAAFADHNFRISFADPSVLILVDMKTKAFAVIYVDDQILTGPNTQLNSRVKHALLAKFPGKDLGEAEFFLQIHLMRDWERRTIKLSQSRHIEDLLQVFGQTNVKPYRVPMDGSIDLSPKGSPTFHKREDYMSLVGSLLYLSMATRPDIAYAAGVLCRYNNAPTINHWNAALRVLAYLKGTINYGLVYGNMVSENGTNGNLKVVAYCDSNFAGDKTDSISTYGYAFMLYGAAFDWTSKKQEKVAHSTYEAEYVAASLTTKEALWVRKLMADCDLKGPITIHIDNQGALRDAQTRNYTPGNRHIGVHYHVCFERVRNGDVEFKFIPTNKQIADIFTKPLGPVEFEKFRTGLGVME